MTTVPAATAPVPRPAEILARAREIFDPLLRESVETLPEPLRHMAGYHLGWWDAGGDTTHTASGKQLRPALAVCACVACGASPATAAPVAAAVELIHNFTLVHDDLMDRDGSRRGRPTVWAVWGPADAILVGDALHALAVRVLATKLPPAQVLPAIERIETTVVELCRGQHADCSIDRRRPTVAECERIAMGKTGALLGCACALGGLSAGAPPAVVTALDRFGRELGLAFQFVDDLIGIWGDPAVTGKPADDLARRKRSLPVVAALRSGTSAALELLELYRSDEPLSSAEIAHATTLIEVAGGKRWTERQADRHVRAALRALPDRLAVADLTTLAHLVAHRDS